MPVLHKTVQQVQATAAATHKKVITHGRTAAHLHCCCLLLKGCPVCLQLLSRFLQLLLLRLCGDQQRVQQCLHAAHATLEQLQRRLQPTAAPAAIRRGTPAAPCLLQRLRVPLLYRTWCRCRVCCCCCWCVSSTAGQWRKPVATSCMVDRMLNAAAAVYIHSCGCCRPCSLPLPLLRPFCCH